MKMNEHKSHLPVFKSKDDKATVNISVSPLAKWDFSLSVPEYGNIILVTS